MEGLQDPFTACPTKMGVSVAVEEENGSSTLSMFYTSLPRIAQRRIPKIHSIRRSVSGYVSPRGHGRTMSEVTVGSSGTETPPPMYRSRPTTPAGAMSRAELSRRSIVEGDDIAVTHAALSTALQRVSASSTASVGIDSKAARHGYALLDLAAREQSCPDPDEELRRRLYIDGVGYLLRSLPETLTFEEEVALRSALPDILSRDIVPPEPRLHAPETQVDQSSASKPILHRIAATSTLYTVLALSIAVPCVQSVCSQAYAMDRRHKISDRVIASATTIAHLTTSQALAVASSVWDLNDGQLRKAVGDLGIWLARDLSGGAHEGVMEAIGRLQLIEKGPRSKVAKDV